MIPIDLAGKRALVMGVANSRSLGWAIAERLRDAGATLAFSYQGERLKADLEKLTQDIPGTLLAQCDVTNEADLSALFGQIRESWGSLDYLVHAIAFAPRPAMDGRYIETTKEDWLTALGVPLSKFCNELERVYEARRAALLEKAARTRRQKRLNAAAS